MNKVMQKLEKENATVRDMKQREKEMSTQIDELRATVSATVLCVRLGSLISRMAAGVCCQWVAYIVVNVGQLVIVCACLHGCDIRVKWSIPNKVHCELGL